MALVRKETGLVYGEIKLDDTGKFLNVDGSKNVGVWDDIANAWAQPPSLRFEKSYTLQQLKTFVAALT